MKYNCMNDSEGVCARQSEVISNSCNNIRSFLVIALHDPDESLKINTRYSWHLHQPMNELNE